MWTLEEALYLIRRLQPKVFLHGYNLCLGGSVLNKGFSTKDLDLYVMRQSLVNQNESGLIDEFLAEGYVVKGAKYFKGIEVVKLYQGKKRIDLIIPNKR